MVSVVVRKKWYEETVNDELDEHLIQMPDPAGD